MARLPICPHCNKEINKEEQSKKYLNRTYHISCYKKIIREKYNNNKGQEDYKQELLNYICEIFQIEEVTPQIISQIDKYYQEFEITYPEMKDCLYYYKEIKNKILDEKYGIAIIPYLINEIRQMYKDINLAIESNKDINIKNAIKQKKIKIKQPDYSYKNNIDMNNL